MRGAEEHWGVRRWGAHLVGIGADLEEEGDVAQQGRGGEGRGEEDEVAEHDYDAVVLGVGPWEAVQAGEERRVREA